MRRLQTEFQGRASEVVVIVGVDVKSRSAGARPADSAQRPSHNATRFSFSSVRMGGFFFFFLAAGSSNEGGHE